jgi:tRNA threonylcarbamoyladenosine biosynthesis protein TsaB
MTCLILEASSEHALLAESGGKTLHLPGGASLSKSLGAEVQKFLGPFQRIIIGAGPGSFTGIRVVAAMGQALAYGWGIPLFTTSSLTAFAPQEDDFAVAVDARSGGIYVQIGFHAPQLLTLDDAARLLQTVPLITSPHPAKILHRLPHLSTYEWREMRPCPLMLERHATLATQPLNLHYLSNIS